MTETPSAADLLAVERKVRHILREWHRLPAVRERLVYRGIPLGEAVEYRAAGGLFAALVGKQNDG